MRSIRFYFARWWSLLVSLLSTPKRLLKTGSIAEYPEEKSQERDVKNLYQLLKHAAETSSAGLTIYLPRSGAEAPQNLSYTYLYHQAREKAQTLHDQGVIRSRAKVLLYFDQHLDAILWFWAVVVAGCVPIVSPPLVTDLGQRKRHLEHLASLLEEPVVLTHQRCEPDFLGVNGLKLVGVETLKRASQPPTSQADGVNRQKELDLAALMLTSGSTGDAKAVCLRHGQILAAVRGKSVHHGTGKDDTFLNWIGLDHVANLTEIHLHAMSLGAQQIHVQAADLLVEPTLFLQLIDRHRVSYTFAPNFFLSALSTRIAQETLTERIDLSCLRALISGGEANPVSTCATLTRQLAPYSARRDFIRPGFGMTETCAGSIYGISCPSYDVAQNVEFASLGTCIPGMSMRVLTDDGKVAITGEEGYLQVSGPVVFAEYLGNMEATRDSFADGWFVTGDRARIDANGQLHLTGRAKETIIINGINHSPELLEKALDEATIPGLEPSYSAVFSYRPKDSETESFCVVYLPTYAANDIETRVATADAIAKVAGMIFSAKPYTIIPLNRSHFARSSLGKISRTWFRKAYAAKKLEREDAENKIAISLYQRSRRREPSTATERLLLDLLCGEFDISSEDTGIDASLFDLGVSSLQLLRFKTKLQDKLALTEEIPLITILTNPSICDMARALDELSQAQQKEYDPVVVLKPGGTKIPLWLVHPGVGEILVFLNLAKYIADRPVYALRARGFGTNEEFFQTTNEAISTYHSHIRRVQPTGPYAIAGYSFGAMFAFEISKLLEAEGSNVAFMGAFNLPPHIKMRMQQLDWIEVLLNLSYFLGFLSEEEAHNLSPSMHDLSHEKALDHVMNLAPPARLAELDLSRAKLARWSSLAHAMQSSARSYDPTGSIARIDVFYAVPLVAVAKTKEEWLDKHLCKWSSFSRSEPRYHEVQGAHYTMLDPDHVLSFQKTLQRVLTARGI